MLRAVPLPAKEAIKEFQKWDDVMPIVETVPRAVPVTVLLRCPPEGVIKRVLSLKIDIEAVQTLQIMERLGADITILEELLASVYSLREVGHLLTKALESQSGSGASQTYMSDPAFQANVHVMFDERMSIVERMKSHAEAMADYIHEVFSLPHFWERCQYNDGFLDVFCLLIHRYRALEQLIRSMAALTNGITFLMMAMSDKAYLSNAPQFTRLWMSRSKDSISQTAMIGKTTGMRHIGPVIPPERSRLILDVVFRFIKHRLTNSDCILPIMQDTYVDSALWIVSFYQRNRTVELSNYKSTMHDQSKVDAMTRKWT